MMRNKKEIMNTDKIIKLMEEKNITYDLNNERYYKEYELINVVNDDSAGRNEITYAYIDKNDEIHFWYKDENNELVKSTYNLDKVKIYETNIEKPVVKFGYGLSNSVVSVELSISRDYIE